MPMKLTGGKRMILFSKKVSLQNWQICLSCVNAEFLHPCMEVVVPLWKLYYKTAEAAIV